MTIEQMEARRLEIQERVNAIANLAQEEGRDLTAEETEEFDNLREEDTRIKGNIERFQYVAGLNQLRPLKATPARPGDGPRVESVVKPRHGKLKAFRKPDGSNDTDQAYRAGMWAGATLWGSAKARQYCQDSGIPLVQAAQVEGDNSKGGALVPDEFINTLIDLQEEYGVARQWCNIRPMGSDTASQPRRTGGLTAYPVGENEEGTESEMAFDNVGLTAKKWMVLAKYSTEWSEDSAISVADLLFREAAIAFATKEDDCLFNGTGAATYHGIQGIVDKFGDGSSYAGATDPNTAACDTFIEIADADISTLMSKLPKYALPTAWFYCSQPAWSLAFERLAQASGGNTKGDRATGTPFAYQGYPVGISQSLPLTGANNKVMLLFGDISMAVTMGTRREVTVRVLTERYAEKDQIGVVATERFDINVHDIGDGTNAGPLVALIGAS